MKKPLIAATIAVCAGTMSVSVPAATASANARSPDRVSGASASAPAAAVGPTTNSEPGRDATRSNEGDPRVDAYWTKERMMAAEDVTLQPPVPLAGDTVPAPSSTEPEQSTPPADPTIPSARMPDPVTKWSTANGKVFFRDPVTGVDSRCSAAAVNSSSKQLVATAGHCVHGGPTGGWHTNWLFVPAYSNGEAPYGRFQGREMRTFLDWMNHGSTPRGYNSDVAFVKTYPQNGTKNLVDVVGGHGIRTGGTIGAFDAQVFGYPATLNGGESMFVCTRRTSVLTVEYKFNRVNGCQYGPGASGGPWLEGYSNSSGLGWLKSVNSWIPVDGSYMAGPHFRSDVMTMLNNTDKN